MDAAIAKKHDKGLWGDNAYYFVENGEMVWGELAKAMANKAVEFRFISDTKAIQLDKEAALEQGGFEVISWGLNSRGKAERLGRLLGWRPVQPSIEEDIENILFDEWQRLGDSWPAHIELRMGPQHEARDCRRPCFKHDSMRTQ